MWTTDVDLWDSMQAVNVRAPFFLLQGAARIMRREGVAGSIVNVGSVSGHGGQPFILAYSVSKGTLATLTKNAAYSLMRHNIRVNQVNPGWMDTAAEDGGAAALPRRHRRLARHRRSRPADRPVDQAPRGRRARSPSCSATRAG